MLSLGESNGTPLQYCCPENPMDGGAWWAAVHGVAKSQTWLSDFTFTFHFHALEKEMATHSSVLAWRIPGMEKPGGLQSMGSHRVGHDWSDLAAAACFLCCHFCPCTLPCECRNQCAFLKMFYGWSKTCRKEHETKYSWMNKHRTSTRVTTILIEEENTAFMLTASPLPPKAFLKNWAITDIRGHNHSSLTNASCCSIAKLCLTLWPHGLQHTRLPCPSPTPRAYADSCPSSQWCYPTISPSVAPFSSCPQSFPASGRVFSNELALCFRWSKYRSFSFSISPSNEYSGLTSFRIGWFDLFVVQHHSSKALILYWSIDQKPSTRHIHS